MIETITDYFQNGEWLAQFLTCFVTIFVPLISLIASLLGKYKNSASKALKEFKDQYEGEMRADMELIKAEIAKLEENLKILNEQTKQSVTNSAKAMAINAVAYANSNLSASTKNEIMNIAKTDNTGNASEIIENSNATIKANSDLDKIEAPAVLEEIANEVKDSEQDSVVL